jgi:hypothetical protein
MLPLLLFQPYTVNECENDKMKVVENCQMCQVLTKYS